VLFYLLHVVQTVLVFQCFILLLFNSGVSVMFNKE